MKYIIVLSLVLSFGKIKAQNQIGQFETTKGEIIKIYNALGKDDKLYEVTFGAQFLYYRDKNGEPLKKAQSKIKKLNIGDAKYINLPIFFVGMKRLHKVVAENDKYLLTSYFSHNFYYYIFDKSNMEAKVKKEKHSLTRKRDRKIFKKINPYFSNCTSLVELLKDTIENFGYGIGPNGNRIVKRTGLGTNMKTKTVTYTSSIFTNINNYQCK